VAVAQRTYVLKSAGRPSVRDALYTGVWGRHTTKHGLHRPRPLPYFFLSAVAAPGFDLAVALDSVPAVFFLTALGFLGSRLLLF
jgi:hypothetical protein